MPSIITFAFNSSAIESIPVDKDNPFALTISNLILEIAPENGCYIVSGNRELMINFQRRYFAKLETNDLIFFQDRIIIFKEETDTEDSRHFLCNFIQNDKNTFIFKLPEVISAKLFSSIFKIAANHPTDKQLYIDCRATQYMNSQSVENMLNFVKKLKTKRVSVCFYKPSQKFLSYLKLANIENLTPIKYTTDDALDSLIKKFSNANYLVTKEGNGRVIKQGEVICVGRVRENSHICLSDRYVSRTHAMIVNISKMLYVIDCCSSNFTFLNREKITPFCLYQLFTGDVISFGGNEIFKIELTE